MIFLLNQSTVDRIVQTTSVYSIVIYMTIIFSDTFIRKKKRRDQLRSLLVFRVSWQREAVYTSLRNYLRGLVGSVGLIPLNPI